MCHSSPCSFPPSLRLSLLPSGITAEGFALKRSTTGAEGSEVSSQRTSENAFDTTSPIAMKLKRRVFDLLGMR